MKNGHASVHGRFEGTTDQRRDLLVRGPFFLAPAFFAEAFLTEALSA